MADKTYRVVASYSIFKCDHSGADHSGDVLMHGAENVVWDDMEYDDVVNLEAAIMCALGGLGLEELDKKKKGKK